MKSGCLYQAATADDRRLVPADVEVETVVANPARQHRRSEDDHCTGGLSLALKK